MTVTKLHVSQGYSHRTYELEEPVHLEAGWYEIGRERWMDSSTLPQAAGGPR